MASATTTTTTPAAAPPAAAAAPKRPLGKVSRLETLGIAGVAGMTAWCFAHPFEMWKNTVMTAPPGTSQLTSLKKVAATGAYTGLASGLGRQIVYTTARLGCYPMFRDTILRSEAALGLRANADPLQANLLDRVLAGASAGVFASFLSSPIEVCLVLQTTSAEKLSVLQAFTGVWRNSGLTGFWRGFGALGTRAALVGISQVAVHDQILTKLRLYNMRRRQGTLNDNLLINVASVLTALFYAAVTMPVEVARVRMSAEAKLPPGTEKRYHNAVQCMGRICKEEGFLAMYDAFLPYFCRCAVHTVLCFFIIEYTTRTIKERRGAAQAQAHTN